MTQRRTSRRAKIAAAAVAGAAALVTISALMPVAASASVRAQAASAARTSAPSLGAEQAALYPIQRTLRLTAQGSCTALLHELSRLAHAGVRSAACTEPAPASFASRARTTLARSLCVPGRIVRTRHASCAVTAIRYQVIQVPGGEVLGTGVIEFAYAEALSNRSWTWGLPVAIDLAAATGVVRAGTVATIVIHCTNCTASGPWVRPLVPRVVYSHVFGIRARGGAVTNTSQAPVVEITNPAATTQALPVLLPSLGPARCDIIAVAFTRGCVFSDVAAVYLVYLKHHNEDGVATNVLIGQRTKPHHFGWFGHGSPLSRATNARVERRNRQAACGKTHFHRPWSCDEYPFAATYQGAFYFPHDVSIRKVLGTQNSAESGYRVSMYRTERLLNLDRYWVFVQP